MSVPETAMRQNNSPVAAKDEIGAPWKFRVVQPETQSGRMKTAAQQQLGLGVLPSDSAHIPPALLGREDVHLMKPSFSRRRRWYAEHG
jgi:hypothetical protein